MGGARIRLQYAALPNPPRPRSPPPLPHHPDARVEKRCGEVASALTHLFRRAACRLISSGVSERKLSTKDEMI